MRKSLVLVLTAASLLTGASAAGASAADEVTVHDGQVTERCWSDLLGAGYTGRAGDGREALYVPAEQLTRVCGVAVLTAEDGSLVPATFYQN